MQAVRFSMAVFGLASLLGGCVTTESAVPPNPEPSPTMESAPATETVPIAVTAEGTTATLVVLPSAPNSQTDILAGAKKPCGTVAADAPKFVEPETK